MLPLAPQLLAVRLRRALLGVLDGVVYDDQVGRVARDAGHNAPADHLAPTVGQLELVRCPDAPLFHAEQLRPELLDLFDVLPPEPLGRVVVVAGLDDPVARIPAQIPAGEALRDRDAVMRRGKVRTDQVQPTLYGDALARFRNTLFYSHDGASALAGRRPCYPLSRQLCRYVTIRVERQLVADLLARDARRGGDRLGRRDSGYPAE